MPTRTSVRETRWARQPVPTPYLTIGDHAPTALAMAGAGRLVAIAAAMGRSEAWIYKAAQGERGPEPELAALFPALFAAGVPRTRAALLVARIRAMFEEAYRADLPVVTELHELETLVDTDEDRLQLPVVRAGERVRPEDLLRYELKCEEASAVYTKMAAACRRARLRQGQL